MAAPAAVVVVVGGGTSPRWTRKDAVVRGEVWPWKSGRGEANGSVEEVVVDDDEEGYGERRTLVAFRRLPPLFSALLLSVSSSSPGTEVGREVHVAVGS